MIHICPTEIAIVMMIYDQIQMYVYHLKHIGMSLFTRKSNDDCKVCNDQSNEKDAQ